MGTHSEQVDAGLLGGVEERLPGEDALGAELAGSAFQQSPVDVERHAVEAQGLDLVKDVEPERRNGKSEVAYVNTRADMAWTGAYRNGWYSPLRKMMRSPLTKIECSSQVT